MAGNDPHDRLANRPIVILCMTPQHCLGHLHDMTRGILMCCTPPKRELKTFQYTFAALIPLHVNSW